MEGMMRRASARVPRRVGAAVGGILLVVAVTAASSSSTLARSTDQSATGAVASVPAAAATTTVYLPNVTRMLGGPDGWQTPFIVQNVDAAPTDLLMSFYALDDGRLVKTRAVQGLAPGRSVFHDPNADAELPAGGQFSVVVTSSRARIAAVVNEHQNVRDPARQEALSYSGLSGGSTVVSLPYVAKRVDGWLTTIVVQNLGTAPTTVTARFVSGTLATSVVRLLAPGRSSAIDPSIEPGLFAGMTYAATLTADQPIAAVVNAHNDAAGVVHPMGFSYNGVSADSSTDVLVPYVADLPAFGGRSATLYVENAGLSAAAPSLLFRRLDLGGDPFRVDLPSLAPGTALSVRPSATSVGAGEYSVEVTGGQFAVVAASTTTTSATGYIGMAEPAERIYLPNVTRTLGGALGWTTPIVVQTASPYRPTITLRWYDFADGSLAFTQTITGLGFGVALRIDPREIPSLTDNTQYSVVIDAPLGAAAVVTELSRSGGDGEMSYEGVAVPASVGLSACAPGGGPAGTTFTCSFAGLPAGSPATVALSTSFGDGRATGGWTVAADGTLTVRRAIQAVGVRTLTVRAGAVTRTAQLNVTSGNYRVAITGFTDRSLSVHTETGFLCLPRITLSDGSVRSGSGDFAPQTTDANGDYTWYYAPLTAPLGPVTADVSCAWSDLVIADERSLVIGSGLYGRVSDRSGAPVPDVPVRVFQGLTVLASLPPITTDAFGNYAVTTTPALYHVQAVPPLASLLSSGYAKDSVTIWRSAELWVTDGSAVRGDVTVSAGSLVKGRVVDTMNQPLPGFNVYVTFGGTYVLDLVTDGNGEFALRLPEGSYAVRVYRPGQCCSGLSLLATSITVSQDTYLPLLQVSP